MKIIVLCTTTPRLYFRGIENYSLQVSEKFFREGHQVEMYTTSPDPQNFTMGNVKIREFPAFSPNEGYHFSPALYSSLKKSDADVIFSTAYNNFLTLAGILAKKKNQKYIIAINLGGEPSPIRRLMNYFFDRIINFYAERINAVICVSPPELEDFKKRLNVPEEKFCMIPMGTDIDSIKKIKKVGKENYIISPGRFVKLKNFHNLIKSFALLAKHMPEMKLLLVGSGPMEEELKRLARENGMEERVIFEREVPLSRISEVHKKIKKSRLFTILHDCGYEGIMAYDAMALEVPVLLCDSKGTLEYVKKGYASAITDPQNHKQLMEKMLEMLKNPEKYTPRNPRIHTWEEAKQKMYRLFLDVVNGTAGKH